MEPKDNTSSTKTPYSLSVTATGKRPFSGESFWHFECSENKESFGNECLFCFMNFTGYYKSAAEIQR